MFVALVYLLLFVAAVAGISLAIQYHRYHKWPPYAWRRRLEFHFRSLQNRRSRILRETQNLEILEEELEAEFFSRHLATVPIARLAEFPGIGSATLDRLEQSGCQDLATVVRIDPTSIRGIGKARANDIESAVKFLVKSARSQFDAGGCPAAHEFRTQLQAVRDEELQREDLRRREISALDQAIHRTEPLIEIARRVSFGAFWHNQGVPGLTDDLLSRAFPEPIAEAVLLEDEPRTEAPSPPSVRQKPARLVALQRAGFERDSRPNRSTGVSRPQTDVFESAPVEHVLIGNAVKVHPWLPKMRAIVEFGFVVAKADGRVAKSERKTIRAFLEQAFAQESELVRHIDPLMERVEAEVADEVRTLIEVCRLTNGAERKALLALAQQIADSTGDCNRREHSAVRRIAAAFGLPDPLIPSPGPNPQHEAPPTPKPAVQAAALEESECRRILEIADSMRLDADLIRRRYNLLLDRLDPTRASALGLEFEKLAEIKRQRVRQAAEMLLHSLGEPLDAAPAKATTTDLRPNPDLDDVFGV